MVFITVIVHMIQFNKKFNFRNFCYTSQSLNLFQFSVRNQPPTFVAFLPVSQTGVLYCFHSLANSVYRKKQLYTYLATLHWLARYVHNLRKSQLCTYVGSAGWSTITGLVDWTGGLDWWTGLVDWTSGLD